MAKVMAAYCWVDGLQSTVGWLPVHWDQLQAQSSITSVEEFYFYVGYKHAVWVPVCGDGHEEHKWYGLRQKAGTSNNKFLIRAITLAL